MNYIENIKKYKRLFSRFSEDDNKKFSEYLKQNNLSIIDFMLEIGLNPELINPFNFQEISEILSSNLVGNEFPKFDFYHETMTLDEQTLSLNINEKNSSVLLNSESLSIISETVEGLEEKEKSITKFVSYKLDENCIINANMIIQVDFSDEQLTGKDRFVSKMTIIAREYKHDKEGQVLGEDKYTFRINSRIPDRIYSDIYKNCFNGSIRPCLVKVLKLLEEGYLKKEDLEITHTFNGLKK